MPLLSRTVTSLVIAAATLGTASAQAPYAQANADYFNLLYSLVDLNPGDGIDPAITFFGASSNAQAQLYDAPDWTGPAREAFQLSGAEGPIRFTATSDDFFLSNYVTSRVGSGLNLIDHGSSLLTFQSNNVFKLTPYTGVNFSAYGSVGTLSGPGSTASAVVNMSGSLHNGPGGGTDDVTTLSSDAGDSSGDLFLEMASGAETVEGNIGFSAILSANVLAVPEPAPAALLAAGLGLFGMCKRRRRHAR